MLFCCAAVEAIWADIYFFDRGEACVARGMLYMRCLWDYMHQSVTLVYVRNILVHVVEFLRMSLPSLGGHELTALRTGRGDNFLPCFLAH